MKRRLFPEISQWVYPVAAVLLLSVPLRWLLAGMASGIFHELCHLAAVRALGYPVLGIRIGVRGMQIRTPAMEPAHELLCAAAGPFGGLLLVSLLQIAPCIAFCALCQSLYNLLPVYPMDGGRMLRCAAMCKKKK